MQPRGWARAFVLGFVFVLAHSIEARVRADAPSQGRSQDDPQGNPGDEEEHAVVVVFGATWCGACHQLEQALREREIPFEIVDVDKNPSAYAWAKKAAGGVNAIPLTGVTRKTETKWIVGADAAAVEKAYKGQ